jgi:hypothetical protein
MLEAKKRAIDDLKRHYREAMTRADGFRTAATAQPTREQSAECMRQAKFEQDKAMRYLEQVEIQGSDEGRVASTVRTRCPYCVQDGTFRLMMELGGRMVCNACGHTSLASDPDYSCDCRHCTQQSLFTRHH